MLPVKNKHDHRQTENGPYPANGGYIFGFVAGNSWDRGKVLDARARNEVVAMIVRYEKLVSRTCGSVRSSLSALARMVTSGSEAAETTPLRLGGAEAAVRWPSATASVNAKSQWRDWMTGSTQVNCRRYRQQPLSQRRCQAQAKQDADRCPCAYKGHTDKHTAGA